jgi:cell division protein FtsA
MSKPDPYLVAIDVGSSKVAVLIGQRDENGGVEVVGKGLAPNRGTRKGNIVNVEATVEALKHATEEAEVMAGIEISRAYVGVASTDVRSINSRGMVSVARKDREITLQDINRVLEAAQSAALPSDREIVHSDREIVHAIPQEFIVDEQGGIADPLGMLGSRLEVALHLVTANVTRRKTLLTCINRAGIEVAEMVFEPLATAEAVLSHDERELGALLFDIGDGTTEYALFVEGEVQHSSVVPVGAGHFTNDLAMVLRTPFSEAEKIKVRFGCCLSDLVNEDEGISVPTVAGGPARVVPQRELCDILQPRAEELLTLVREDLRRHSGDGRTDIQLHGSLRPASRSERSCGRHQLSDLGFRIGAVALRALVGRQHSKIGFAPWFQCAQRGGKPPRNVHGPALSLKTPIEEIET